MKPASTHEIIGEISGFTQKWMKSDTKMVPVGIRIEVTFPCMAVGNVYFSYEKGRYKKENDHSFVLYQDLSDVITVEELYQKKDQQKERITEALEQVLERVHFGHGYPQALLNSVPLLIGYSSRLIPFFGNVLQEICEETNQGLNQAP